MIIYIKIFRRRDVKKGLICSTTPNDCSSAGPLWIEHDTKVSKASHPCQSLTSIFPVFWAIRWSECYSITNCSWISSQRIDELPAESHGCYLRETVWRNCWWKPNNVKRVIEGEYRLWIDQIDAFRIPKHNVLTWERGWREKTIELQYFTYILRQTRTGLNIWQVHGSHGIWTYAGPRIHLAPVCPVYWKVSIVQRQHVLCCSCLRTQLIWITGVPIASFQIISLISYGRRNNADCIWSQGILPNEPLCTRSSDSEGVSVLLRIALRGGGAAECRSSYLFFDSSSSLSKAAAIASLLRSLNGFITISTPQQKTPRHMSPAIRQRKQTADVSSSSPDPKRK